MLNVNALSKYAPYPIKKICHRMMIRFAPDLAISRATFCFDIMYSGWFNIDVSTVEENYITLNNEKVRLDFDSIYLDLSEAALKGAVDSKTLLGIIHNGIKSSYFDIHFMPEYLLKRSHVKRLAKSLPRMLVKPAIIVSLTDMVYERAATTVHAAPFALADIPPDSQIGRVIAAFASKTTLSDHEAIRLTGELGKAMKEQLSVSGNLDIMLFEKDANFHDPTHLIGSQYSIHFVSPDNTGEVKPYKGDSFISRGRMNIVYHKYGRKFNREKMLKCTV